MATLKELKSSSGLTKVTHESTNLPAQKDAMPTWQMLDESGLAVSTSITTKSTCLLSPWLKFVAREAPKL
jgi:hypothetical protein